MKGLEHRMQAAGSSAEAGETPADVQLARGGAAPLARALEKFMADAYSGKEGAVTLRQSGFENGWG